LTMQFDIRKAARFIWRLFYWGRIKYLFVSFACNPNPALGESTIRITVSIDISQELIHKI